MTSILSSEITPEQLFWQRRRLLALPLLAGAGVLLNACGAADAPTSDAGATPLPISAGVVSTTKDELGNPLTPFETVTGYNNYYEFSTDKERVKDAATGFVTTPWSVVVDGMVAKPRTFGLEDMLALDSAERIYRLRCVEGWSMVIPWVGISLADVVKRYEPLGSAKYVVFETIMRPAELPGQRDDYLVWPYIEALRMDEAVNPLAILAVGMYGKTLPNQNGAPIRLVAPWKYGFKGIKSIVRITFADEAPENTWKIKRPTEYGFYANVNPLVDHPRHTQATERRISGGGLRSLLESRRPTLMFNGYEEEVAHLYTGMDLARNF